MSIFGLQTSNPAFSSYFWKTKRSYAQKKMSVNGILFKSFLMLCLVTSSACYTWQLFFNGEQIKWYTSIGMFVAIITSLFISFKHNLAKYLLPIYALAKGFFLGGISAYAHQRFPNLPFQAIGVTILTFFMIFFLYRFKFINVTRKFRAILITAITTIFMLYFMNWILRFINIQIPFLFGTSWLAIGFNLLTVLVTAFSLLLDFYYINKKVGRYPKEQEWLATWGLLITLIWLYVEVLRLMKKLAIRF